MREYLKIMADPDAVVTKMNHASNHVIYLRCPMILSG